MSRFLKQLEEITEGEREASYGHPLENFLRIAIRWNAYLSKLGVVLDPVDVAMMMIDVKIARLENGYQADSVLDIAGYASAIGRMDERLVDFGYDQGIKIFNDMENTDMIELLANLVSEED